MASEHRQVGIDGRHEQADVVSPDDLDEVGDIGRIVSRAQPDSFICKIECRREGIDISGIRPPATRSHVVNEGADERRSPPGSSEQNIRWSGHLNGPGGIGPVGGCGRRPLTRSRSLGAKGSNIREVFLSLSYAGQLFTEGRALSPILAERAIVLSEAEEEPLRSLNEALAADPDLDLEIHVVLDSLTPQGPHLQTSRGTTPLIKTKSDSGALQPRCCQRTSRRNPLRDR